MREQHILLMLLTICPPQVPRWMDLNESWMVKVPACHMVSSENRERERLFILLDVNINPRCPQGLYLCCDGINVNTVK